MKFSLTQECQTMTRDYYNRYWQMMREVELADQLGWDSYSLSEQHFTPTRIYDLCAGDISRGRRDAYQTDSSPSRDRVAHQKHKPSAQSGRANSDVGYHEQWPYRFWHRTRE